MFLPSIDQPGPPESSLVHGENYVILSYYIRVHSAGEAQLQLEAFGTLLGPFLGIVKNP